MNRAVLLLMLSLANMSALQCTSDEAVNRREAVSQRDEPVFKLVGTVTHVTTGGIWGDSVISEEPYANFRMRFEYSGKDQWIDDGANPTTDAFGFYSVSKGQDYFGKDYRLSYEWSTKQYWLPQWYYHHGLIRNAVDTVNIQLLTKPG